MNDTDQDANRRGAGTPPRGRCESRLAIGGVALRLAPTLTDEELELHYRWQHEPRAHHLHVVLEEGQTFRQVSREDLRKHWQAPDPAIERFIVEHDGRPVGEASIHVDPEWLHRKVEGSGWLGLCIGEASQRNRGIGRKVMGLLHRRCLELGCCRIEIGVFEHNARARHLYRSLGYQEIAEIERFTWFDGRWSSDIRMELDPIPAPDKPQPTAEIEAQARESARPEGR